MGATLEENGIPILSIVNNNLALSMVDEGILLAYNLPPVLLKLTVLSPAILAPRPT